MTVRWPQRTSGVLPLALLLCAAACTTSPPPAAVPQSSHVPRRSAEPIVIASFDFPESVLLANIYGRALADHGYPIRVLPDLGTRELVDPALMRGLVQLVPEYAGSALEFAGLGRSEPSASVSATHGALAAALSSRGLMALAPAPAQDNNAIVVSAQTASRYGLRSISDLEPVANRLVLGGPPECPERPLCLPGLRRVYGLSFKQFVPLDTGGPLTIQALTAGQIDVALLFTTDPGLSTHAVVVLADNRNLQPAENVTPVVDRQTVARYGSAFVRVVDQTSAALTTEALRALDTSMVVHGRSPGTVAVEWLRAQDLD